MVYSMLFVIWYSMKKAYINDARLEKAKNQENIMTQKIKF